MLVACDHVRVALDDHRDASLDDRLLGQMQAEERRRLVEDRRLRAVQVFRLVLLPELSAAKGDRPAQCVTDREDQPIPQSVVMALTPGPRGDQARHLKDACVPALLTYRRDQPVPTVSRAADLELLDHLFVDPAMLDVLEGRRALLGVTQD